MRACESIGRYAISLYDKERQPIRQALDGMSQ